MFVYVIPYCKDPLLTHRILCIMMMCSFGKNVDNFHQRCPQELPIRWVIGSLNKQNKNVEQNCIFERAGRGTIVRVTISMSITSVENHTKVDFTGN